MADWTTMARAGALRADDGAASGRRSAMTAALAASSPPAIDLDGAGSADTATLAYTENDPLTVIAPGATLADADQPATYEGAILTVSFTSGAGADDLLRVASSGDLVVDDVDLYYREVPIGTVSGGDRETPLTIGFNADATPEAVEAVLRAVGFVSFSENPAPGDRIVAYSLTEGDGTASPTVTATVSVTPVQDAPIAEDDRFFTLEHDAVVGSLFDDNGFGPDTDPDGPPIRVTHVNGQEVVGQTILLDSGARLTVNADGTFRYDPAGAFDSLTDETSGAVNTSAQDGFSYTITGGETADVVVTIGGVAGPGDELTGDAEDDFITGTEGPDVFMLQQGGNDTAFGLGGYDGFFFGATLNAADSVDGGAGSDQIALQGDYAGVPLTLGAGLINVESIALLRANNPIFGGESAGLFSYDITTVTQNVASGEVLVVDGAQLRAGENFTFDGAAETDGGRFRLFGGFGIDLLTGGSSADLFQFSAGRFGASDRVDGGAGGRDELALRGNYDLTFGAEQLTGIEVIVLLSGRDTVAGVDYDYDIATEDSNVAAGAELIVDAGQLKAGEQLTFDGGAEASRDAEGNGTFRVFGGKGDDLITGGGGADSIAGGLGGDTLYGGRGGDRFIYRSAPESTGGGRDAIQDFALGDVVDLSKVDADLSTIANESFEFIGEAESSGGAGELRVERQGGSVWLVEGETDGVEGADFELLLVIADAHTPTAEDFIL